MYELNVTPCFSLSAGLFLISSICRPEACNFFPVVSEKRPVLQSHPATEIPWDTNLPAEAQVQDQTLATNSIIIKRKIEVYGIFHGC